MQKKYLGTTSAIALVVAIAAFVSFKVYAEKDGGIAARVNGEVISIEEIREGYDNNPQIAAQVNFDQFYPKAVDVFVNGKLLYQAATKANIQETPAYKTQLKTAQEDLARKVYLEGLVKEKVSDAEVKNVYDQDYVKKFESKKEIKAKHILVDNEATAKEVIRKLNQGENFDALAKQYSKEPADLGYFTEDIMVPEFAKASFAMKKGSYSKVPVKTQFGYHVIEVEDIRNSSPLPLKDVEPQIKNMLTQKILAETFDDLSKNSKIEKYDLNGNIMPATQPSLAQ